MCSLHSSITSEVLRLESLHPNDVFLIFDTEGIYHYVSANREALMGYSREETYGRHYSDFVAPDYVSHAQLNLDDTILTGESIDSGVTLIAKDGSPIYFRTVAFPISDPDGREYMIVRARPKR